MATTNTGHFTILFADAALKSFSYDDMPTAALPYMKSKINAINANEDGAFNAFRATFVSNAGASFSKISEAKIVTVEEEVIYNG